jgi:hypothetical protein
MQGPTQPSWARGGSGAVGGGPTPAASPGAFVDSWGRAGWHDGVGRWVLARWRLCRTYTELTKDLHRACTQWPERLENKETTQERPKWAGDLSGITARLYGKSARCERAGGFALLEGESRRVAPAVRGARQAAAPRSDATTNNQPRSRYLDRNNYHWHG